MNIRRRGIVVLATVLLVGCQAPVVKGPGEHGRASSELRAAVIGPEEVSPCEGPYRSFVERLEAIAAEFREAGPEIPVAKLVELDARIRGLVNDWPTSPFCWLHKGLYDAAWKEIGIEIGYDENLEYSGSLLRQAHALDPDSPYRASTLFSTVRDIETTAFPHVPDLRACRRYEAEFPNGPFAKDVFESAASVHKEIFMILRDGESGDSWGCLEKFAKLKPREFQLDRAQRLALEYYDKALAIDPTDEHLRELRDAVAHGTVNSWHYCGC